MCCAQYGDICLPPVHAQFFQRQWRKVPEPLHGAGAGISHGDMVGGYRLAVHVRQVRCELRRIRGPERHVGHPRLQRANTVDQPKLVPERNGGRELNQEKETREIELLDET